MLLYLTWAAVTREDKSHSSATLLGTPCQYRVGPRFLPQSFNSSWLRLDEVLEAFLRHSGPCWSDIITELLQICRLHPWHVVTVEAIGGQWTCHGRAKKPSRPPDREILDVVADIDLLLLPICFRCDVFRDALLHIFVLVSYISSKVILLWSVAPTKHFLPEICCSLHIFSFSLC